MYTIANENFIIKLLSPCSAHCARYAMPLCYAAAGGRTGVTVMADVRRCFMVLLPFPFRPDCLTALHH